MSDHGGRLPLLAADGLEPEQQELYDEIARGPRAAGPFSVVDGDGHLLGPFNALLHAPGVGAPVERLGAALRFSGEIDARTRELVICSVAAHWRSDYEWYTHSRMGRSVGVSPAELESVRDGQIPESASSSEVAALRLTLALLRDRTVPVEVYAGVVDHHGATGVVELCALVGYYQLLGGMLAAADIPAPVSDDDAEGVQ